MSMNSVKDRLVEKIAFVVTQYPLPVIFAAFLLAIILSAPLFRLQVDPSIKNYLQKDDPYAVDYERFKDVFGSDERIVIGVRSSDIFARNSLERLRGLHRALANDIPYVGKVQSIVSVPYFYGERDNIRTGRLLDNWPESEENRKALVERILSVPGYRGSFYTEDRTFAVIVLTIRKGAEQKVIGQGSYEDVLAGFEKGVSRVQIGDEKPDNAGRLSRKENDLLVDRVHALIKEYQGDDFQLYVSGLPLYKKFVRETIVQDSTKFICFSVLVVALLLFFVFKRISAVVLPFIVVAASLGSTMGLFTFFDRQVNSVTTIFPSLLIAVGVSSCVHVLSLFFQHLRKGANRTDAIRLSLEHSGFTIFIANLTTAAGVFSFSAAQVAPVANLGIFGGIGVLLSLFYTLFLMPAMLAIIPMTTKPMSRAPLSSLNMVLDRIARFAVTHARLVIFFCIALSLSAAPGLLHLRLSHNPLEWLPEKTPVRVATSLLDQHFGGIVNVEIIVDSQVSDGFRSTAWQKKLEALVDGLQGVSTEEVQLGKTLALPDMIKLVNWSIQGSGLQGYSLPDNKDMLAQELLLLELSSSSILSEMVDPSFRYGRITLHVPWVDAVSYGRFLKKIEDGCRSILGSNTPFTVTGHIPLLSRTVYVTLKSMVTSYLIAGIVITILIIFLLGNLQCGLVSIVPNLFPIVVALGVLGWLDVPMDMLTMLVGCIAFGLIVDDTIHFMYNFHRYYMIDGRVEDAVHKTIQTSGRAMFITSMILIAATLVLMMSPIHTIRNFGMAMGMTIFIALFADIVLAPALMAVIYNKDK
jgi:predicted RND superfamily exporter protein